MNLNKLYGYLTPDKNLIFNIIGCGAIGSTVAENLVRLGYEKFNLFDFDVVSPHNITNQNFTALDINKEKTECLRNYMLNINPDILVKTKGKYTSQNLSGVVILAVDNIDTRKEIIQSNLGNNNIKYWIDFRMGLTQAQTYFTQNSLENKEWLLNTMDFTHEEAVQNTPVSPCGTTLNVITTVKTICALGTQNIINAELNNKTSKVIIIDLNNFSIINL